MNILRYLYKSQRKNYLPLFILTVFVLFLVSALNVVQSILFMVFMNRALNVNDYPLWALIVAALIYLVVFFLLSLLSSYLKAKMRNIIHHELVLDSLDCIFNLPASTFNKQESSSSITNFITNEINNVLINYFDYIFQLIPTAFVIILGLIYLCTMSVYFVLPIFILAILVFLLIRLTKNKIDENYNKQFKASKKVIKMMNNLSNFFFVSKMFHYRDSLFITINDTYKYYTDTIEKNQKYDSLVDVLNSTLSMLTVLSIYSLAVYLVLNNTITAGAIVSIIDICGSIIQPFFVIAIILRCMNSTLPTRKKITDLLKNQQTNKDVEPIHIESLSASSLSFSYEKDKPVLKDISFSFHKGEIIGIQGESGCGKSTLFKILSKIEDSYQGNIFVNDEKELRSIQDASYFKSIKFLGQEPIILNATVKENILLNLEYDEKRFISIMRLLKLDTNFEDKEGKYDLILDSEKENYSLGEARRICIARLLYAHPSFMVLDEPFASLDEENRSIIEEALLSYKDSCIILSSHIFSSSFYNQISQVLTLEKQTQEKTA